MQHLLTTDRMSQCWPGDWLAILCYTLVRSRH